MKITRLKLVNFIGIKHGTGKDEIEIFFDTEENRGRKIVMLTGGNGSGKTTILSQLHPFKDSYDERSSVIIAGLEGRKEIDIKNANDEYEIVHIYTKKSQSFIKKNGEELNENGGVNTFLEIALREFGITSDYFKLGKIGSNAKNFVDLPASERKKYMSRIMPELREYDDKYEIVKKKYNIVDNKVKTISDELNKLEDEQLISDRISRASLLIETLGNQIETSSNRLAVINSELKTIADEMGDKTLEDVIKQINEKTDQQSKLGIDVATFNSNKETEYKETDIDSLDILIEEKDEHLLNSNNDLTIASTERKGKHNEILGLVDEVDRIKIRLTSTGNESEIPDLEKKLEEAKINRDSISKEIKSSEYANIIKEAQNDTPSYVYKFEIFKNFMLKYFNNFRNHTFMNTKIDLELFMEEDFDTHLNTQSNVLREIIEQNIISIKEKEKLLLIKQANSGKIDILGQRPVNCEIPTCPFIKDALLYKDLPKEIEALEKEIGALEVDLEKNENKADQYVELKNLFKSFREAYNQMNPRTNLVYNYFIKTNGQLVDQIKGSLSEFQVNTEKIIKDINDLIEKINKHNEYKTAYDNVNYKLNTVRESSSLRKSLNDDLTQKEANLTTLKSEFAELTSKVSTKTQEVEAEKLIVKEYKTLVANLRSLRSLKTTLYNLKDDEKRLSAVAGKLKSNKAEKEGLDVSLADLRKRKADSEKELSTDNNMLYRVQSTKTTLEEIQKNYGTLSLLVEALSPTKGIPLVFINSYLEKTKFIVNELLSLAYGDDFEVDFVLNQSDFLIRIRAGENIKEDIKEASQGEVALTTISLSLALIQQSIEKFNILTLDEIDGPLDESNRQNFITILNKQVDSMGIEQVFVISHNNAFDSEDMDLIMLRGSPIDINNQEFMNNKRVVFNIAE
jgi:DNA repair exonuclease SbcCD ATPase subunit